MDTQFRSTEKLTEAQLMKLRKDELVAGILKARASFKLKSELLTKQCTYYKHLEACIAAWGSQWLKDKIKLQMDKVKKMK